MWYLAVGVQLVSLQSPLGPRLGIVDRAVQLYHVGGLPEVVRDDDVGVDHDVVGVLDLGLGETSVNVGKQGL